MVGHAEVWFFTILLIVVVAAYLVYRKTHK